MFDFDFLHDLFKAALVVFIITIISLCFAFFIDYILYLFDIQILTNIKIIKG